MAAGRLYKNQVLLFMNWYSSQLSFHLEPSQLFVKMDTLLYPTSNECLFRTDLPFLFGLLFPAPCLRQPNKRVFCYSTGQSVLVTTPGCNLDNPLTLPWCIVLKHLSALLQEWPFQMLHSYYDLHVITATTHSQRQEILCLRWYVGFNAGNGMQYIQGCMAARIWKWQMWPPYIS